MTGSVVLAVLAHPDDEVLMAGATLARHAAEGDQVFLLFVSDGETARFADRTDPEVVDLIAGRKDAARVAAGILGAAAPRFLDFPDNRLDSVDLLDIVKAVEAVVGRYAPETVYTHFDGDLNIDHQIVARAVRTACRPIPGSSVRRILAGEVLSSSEWAAGRRFAPTHFVGGDWDGTFAKKRAALAAYGTEIPAPPHPRSLEAVEALSRRRGAECGLPHAEAFEVIRSRRP